MLAVDSSPRPSGLCRLFLPWRKPQRGGAAAFGGRGAALGAAPRPAKQKARAGGFASGPRFWLSKKWLAPLFRGFHSSLAPTARPGSYAEKPLLRKAFCGFAVHAAKSDYSLRGLRPPNPQGFFDRLKPGPEALPPARAFQGASRPAAAPLRWVFRRRQGRMKFPGLSSIQLRSARTIPPGKAAAHTLRAAAEQSPCRGLLRGGAFTPSCANLAVGAAQKRDRKTGLFRLLLVGD